MRNFLSIVVLLFCTAYGNAADRYKVVASASMIGDIASEVAGDLVDIELIVPIGGDPHIYEPTPSDVRLVHDADLVLINGLTFEGWITELVENSGTKATMIVVTDGIDVLSSQDYENAADPHAWMDVFNASMYATNIARALVSMDPKNEETYQANLAAYQAELAALDRYVIDQIKTIPADKRILVTSHDAFQYYGRRYGIELQAIMGISTEAEAQTSDIRRVGAAVRESGIPAIFVESTINPKLIEQLASDHGVRIGGKLYADSLGDMDSGAATYIDMIRHNTDTIVKALSAQKESIGDKENEGSGLALWILAGVLALGLIIVMIIMNNRS